MRIFKCRLTGDEMFTDTYPMQEADGFYVVKGKYVTRKGDSVDDSLIGGNPSAEEGGDDAAEAGTESGVDIIMDSRLKETGFGNKKEYTVYMKEYMANVLTKLKETLPEEKVTEAKIEANGAFKAALAKFKSWQFYTGGGDDPDGHIALLDWLDEEVDGKSVSTPYMYFYKIGLVSEKV